MTRKDENYKIECLLTLNPDELEDKTLLKMIS